MTAMLPVLFLLLALLDGPAKTDASYAVKLKPAGEDCYIFRTPPGSKSLLTGSFECLDDDVESEKVAVRVANLETGEAAYEAPTGDQEGDFRLEGLAGDSRYSLCFRNLYGGADDDGGEDNAFHVGFSLRLRPAALERTLEDGEAGPDGERALKLVRKATLIHQDWDTLRDHFDFLRNREAMHEEMNDEILLRLTRWTFVESFLVVAMAVGQVVYWKKFFETRRYL